MSSNIQVISDSSCLTSTSSILLFGSTGFIGGCLLNSILTQPIKESNGSHNPPSTYLRILTSSSSKAHSISSYCSKHLSNSSLKIEIISISRDDSDKWYSESLRLSSLSSTVLQIATSDDLKLTKAINAGLFSSTRQSNGLDSKGSLIHLSGVQLIESKPIGEYVDVIHYDDLNVKQLEEIPDEAAHRFIDLEIEQDRKNDKIWADIVCPALVWGRGVGPGERTSGLTPDMVRKSIYNSQAVYAGKGDNVWCAIHISDLISMLRSFLNRAFSKNNLPSPQESWSSFYFASHPHHINFKDLSQQIGLQLLESKVISNSEPKSVPCPTFDPSQKGVRIEDDDRANAKGVESKEEKERKIEEEKSTPAWPCRTNCKADSNRAQKDFGWKAELIYDEEAMRKDTKDCLEVWAEEQGGWEKFRKAN